MARVGVITFLGSLDDRDAMRAVGVVGGEAVSLWHGSTDLQGVDAILLPGGFSYGDHLRCGALARFSPIMGAVAEFAAAGGPVLGICNGFQVLTEAGLLPGALQKNRGLTFLCQPSQLEVVTSNSILTSRATVGAKLSIPINHFSGSYTCDDATYERLVANDQIVLRYVENPNGSRDAIAGVSNEAGNVVGLMPHPERAMTTLLGSSDGRVLLESFVAEKLATR